MMLQVFQIIEATAEVARLADTAAVLVAARGRLLARLGGNMTLQEARLAEYEVRGETDRHVSRVTCHVSTSLAACCRLWWRERPVPGWTW